MIDLDLSIIGERIKSARTEKKLTLEKLSEQIGISRNFLWEIEAGRKAPAILTLYNIGKSLNLSIDYILGLSNNIKWLETKNEQNINDIVNEFDKKELDILYKLLKEYINNK